MPTPAVTPSTEQNEVLIFAPTGQDARLIAGALLREEIGSAIFLNIDALCERLKAEAGVILVAEEALTVTAIARLNEFLAKQQPWSDIPLIVMTSSGESTLASLRILKAFSPNGNVTLLERPVRPITLVSTLQVALRARKRQYQVRQLLEYQAKATKIRDEFISIASHELKTPLTSLKLQTQISKRLALANNPAAFAPDRVLKLIDTTDSQVDRLARLVEDMLDVSRIGSGKLVMQRTTFDVVELVHELIERFGPQLTAAGCATEIIAPKAVIGTWDRYRLEQVINNLLTNAIRYSHGKPLSIAVKDNGVKVAISLRDEGPGIAVENRERIFNRFERAVGSRSISGLGLGLYICRQIVESHHGSISLESELGKGSTFIVELPLSPPLAHAAP